MSQPAAREGDDVLHKGGKGAILIGCSTVLIGTRPAAREGDPVAHGKGKEPIIEGEPTVLIGGRPAARIGDHVACEGAVAEGCESVRIGLTLQGACLQTASQEGDAFVQAVE
ncbi:MAG: PAAR domain-containing protein [Aquimonas sp.]|nr:PAAR domain-containing protein [Aquimonas sp.]